MRGSHTLIRKISRKAYLSTCNIRMGRSKNRLYGTPQVSPATITRSSPGQLRMVVWLPGDFELRGISFPEHSTNHLRTPGRKLTKCWWTNFGSPLKMRNPYRTKWRHWLSTSSPTDRTRLRIHTFLKAKFRGTAGNTPSTAAKWKRLSKTAQEAMRISTLR